MADAATTAAAATATPDLPPQAAISRPRRVVLVIALLVGMLFSTLDTSIVSTSLITISRDLGDFVNASWVILAYLLTYMGFAVCIAKLSDIYGRRNMVVSCWVLFIAFSMACAVSQSMTQLIVFRAFQGLGGSGLYSMTQIGLIEVGPAGRPGLIGAMIGLTLAVAFVLGPLLGGIISHYWTWRWIFNLNIPFGLGTIVAVVGCWPEEKVANVFSMTAFRSIDFFGGATLLLASGFLIFGLQEAGLAAKAWLDPVVISSLVIAAFSWAVFIGWEARLSSGGGWLGRLAGPTPIQPMFPIRLVKHRVYMGGLLVTLFTGFSHLALTVTIPERFQVVNGQDALSAGLHLLPLLGACALGSFLAGVASSRRNRTAMTLVAAAGLQLLGVTLMAVLEDPAGSASSPASSPAQYAYQAVFGLGVGLSYGAATILTGIHAARREDDLAAAQGAVAQARVLGGCVGISVCALVFNSATGRPPAAADADACRLTPAELSALRHTPLAMLDFPDPVRSAVRAMYAAAFAEDTRIMVFVAVAMLVAALLTWERHPTPLERLTGANTKTAAADAAASGSHDCEAGGGGGRDTEMSDLGSVRSVG